MEWPVSTNLTLCPLRPPRPPRRPRRLSPQPPLRPHRRPRPTCEHSDGRQPWRCCSQREALPDSPRLCSSPPPGPTQSHLQSLPRRGKNSGDPLTSGGQLVQRDGFAPNQGKTKRLPFPPVDFHSRICSPGLKANALRGPTANLRLEIHPIPSNAHPGDGSRYRCGWVMVGPNVT